MSLPPNTTKTNHQQHIPSRSWTKKHKSTSFFLVATSFQKLWALKKKTETAASKNKRTDRHPIAGSAVSWPPRFCLDRHPQLPLELRPRNERVGRCARLRGVQSWFPWGRWSLVCFFLWFSYVFFVYFMCFFPYDLFYIFLI